MIAKGEVKVKTGNQGDNKIVSNNRNIGEKVEVKKLSSVQNFITKKIAKKLVKTQTQALDENLKMAIVFAAAALILSILGAFSWFFWLLGTAAIIIAIVFFVLWVLEQ